MKQSKNHCESSEIPNVCSRNAIWGKLKIRVDLQEIRVEIKSKMHTRILATKSLKQFYESTLKSPASASPAPQRTHQRWAGGFSTEFKRELRERGEREFR